jgi:hypothetical protein
VLLSFGLVVPFRAPFGMPVAALPDDPGAPPAITTPVGAEKMELELENAVDDGNEDELEDRSDDELGLELDDENRDEDDRREELDDAPAAIIVALLPVIALMIAGKGPELDALMLAAKTH